MIMRAMVSTLMAVAVLGLVALPVRALDARIIYEHQDRQSH
jgi:hypothetical protein